jgi:hypothetical protein
MRLLRLVAVLAAVLAVGRASLLERFFRARFDHDGNGLLTASELQDGMLDANPRACDTVDSAATVIALYDTDHE